MRRSREQLEGEVKDLKKKLKDCEKRVDMQDGLAYNQGMKPEVRATFSEMGKKGGKGRWKNVPPEKRRELAKKAAAARWGRLDSQRNVSKKTFQGDENK